MKTQPLNGKHILIVGTTGSGKTHTLKYLLSTTEGEIHVLDPHAAPNEWPKNCQVHGAGRNFTDINNTLQQARNELNHRYQERSKGTKEFQQLTIALDELPSICSEVEEANTIFSQIAREGRKVKMFLALSTQSDRVKTLNIAGEGDVRDNFATIRMIPFKPGRIGKNRNATLTIGETRTKITIPKEIPETQQTTTPTTMPATEGDVEENWLGFTKETAKLSDTFAIAKRGYKNMEPQGKKHRGLKKAWQIWSTAIGTGVTGIVLASRALKKK